MKYIIKILLFSICTFSCSAQTHTLDISDQGWKLEDGAYYKDQNNLLDPFVGTYLYTNGNTSLKIVLQKKTMSTPANNRYYEDLIIGEYQYIKNGVQLANTLGRLNVNKTNGWKYSINGNSIMTNASLCRDCGPNEKALKLSFVDDITDNYALIFLIRRVVENGKPAIKINLRWGSRTHIKGTPSLPSPNIPGGEYILKKI